LHTDSNAQYVSTAARDTAQGKIGRTATPVAVAFVVLPAAGLAEVADGAELGPERLAGVPPAVEVLARLGTLKLEVKASVDVANQVVADVVADVELEQVAELSELAAVRTGARSAWRPGHAARTKLWLGLT
jgi:hypothetical protein